MQKKMTITLDQAVYDGLYRRIGKRKMSKFIEELVKPHVLDTSLDEGYRAMGADRKREMAAVEWCDSGMHDLAKDLPHETW
jgi:predicted CopG family antitoxin